MKVQAKFWVSEIRHHGGWQQEGPQSASVELMPVTADRPENETWSKYTPAGKIELLITNMDAVEQFELGGEYLLTFEKT